MIAPDDGVDPQAPAGERGQLARIELLLQEQRPAPEPGFRGRLGRAVQADAQQRHIRPRPAHLWLWVGAAAGTGLGLLLVALFQV